MYDCINPKLSIIVMTYKNASNLCTTIDSILKQNFVDYEIIISDDCTPDIERNYFEIEKEKCIQQNKAVLLNYNSKNIGTVKHFNNLIKKARGQYIIPLSCGDSFIDEHVLSDIYNCFQDTGYNVITTKRRGIIDNKEKTMPERYQLDIFQKSTEQIFNYICKYADLISGSNTYYNKKVFEKYGYFDETLRLLEDCPYYLKLLYNNEKIYFFDRVSIVYDMTGVSTGKMNPLLIEDFEKMYICINNDYRDKLTFLTRRFVQYRIDKYKNSSNSGKINIIIKYVDVILILLFRKYYIKRRG